MILNGKENKEAGAICFDLRVPRKKNKEMFWKFPSKIYGSNFIMEKKKNLVSQYFQISSPRNGARNCREDGKSRNTAARLVGGLHGYGS